MSKFKVSLVVILGVLLLVGVPLLVLGITTGLSPLFGRGHAYQQQQSSDNRIFAQQQFHDLYQEYQATVHKLPAYKTAAANGDTVAQTNLLGLQSHCQDVVSEYNSAANKYLTKDFQDAQLPVNLDRTPCTS